MPKNRVGLQIKEAFLGQKLSSNKNENLEALTAKFNTMRHQIRDLIEALRAQHLSLLRLNETRLLVAEKVAVLAQNSPLVDQAGEIHGEDTSSLSSYLAVHHTANARQSTFSESYMKHVVDYAVEWERVIVGRVSSSLKTAARLRRDLDHYQSKVETIRLEINRIMTKGKMVDTKLSTKMKRNEEKFTKSRGEYQAFTTDLCILIEEVTLRSWKDLHPILLKLAQFDFTLAKDEHNLFLNLNNVAESLKQIAATNGLRPEARLKDLETLNAKVVMSSNTLQQSVAGDGVPPLLQNGSNLSAGSMEYGNQDPGGSGQSNDLLALRDEGGSGNWSNPQPMSTSQMMSVAQNAAPPPTLDMVTQSLQQTTINDTYTNQGRSASPYRDSGGFSPQNRSVSPYRGPGTNPFDAPPSPSGSPSGGYASTDLSPRKENAIRGPYNAFGNVSLEQSSTRGPYNNFANQRPPRPTQDYNPFG